MILVSIRFIAVVLFVGACSMPTPAAGADLILSAQPLAVDADDYGALAWADDDTLVLNWYPPPLSDGRNQGARLVALDLEDTAHRELPHEVSNAECDFIEESWPTRLVDGRIGFLRHWSCTTHR